MWHNIHMQCLPNGSSNYFSLTILMEPRLDSLSLSCYISETDKTFQFDRNNLSVRECWLSALLYREVIPPHLNINYVLLVSVNTGRLMAEGGGENGATVR